MYYKIHWHFHSMGGKKCFFGVDTNLKKKTTNLESNLFQAQISYELNI